MGAKSIEGRDIRAVEPRLADAAVDLHNDQIVRGGSDRRYRRAMETSRRAPLGHHRVGEIFFIVGEGLARN